MDRPVDGLLGREQLERQRQDHTQIRSLRAIDACDFVLDDPNFLGWWCGIKYQRLVILGEIGCGKTFAMSFLIDIINERSKWIYRGFDVCYYYCRIQNIDHDISRALVLSILDQLPWQKEEFHNWFMACQASEASDQMANTIKLGEHLRKLLATRDRLLFIAIDGLDNCSISSRDTVLSLVHKLSKNNPNVKIVLSSCSEESILEQLEKEGYLMINMVSDTDRDAIIARHTVKTQLPGLTSEAIKSIAGKISPLAKGSAIWTKKFFEFIADKGIDTLDEVCMHPEKSLLPDSLACYYDAVLTRGPYDESRNRQLGAKALGFIAIACRPLSLRELAWAITLSEATENDTINSLSVLVDHREVMSLIHPFVTRVDYADVDKRQVQLVHPSVEEFAWLLASGNSSASNFEYKPYFVRYVQAEMLDICIRHLLLDEVDTTSLFSKTDLAREHLPREDIPYIGGERGFIHKTQDSWQIWGPNEIQYDPAGHGAGNFFGYATSFWKKHLDTIYEHDILVYKGEQGPLSALIYSPDHRLELYRNCGSDEKCILRRLQAYTRQVRQS
jgi:hypothetical protein